MSIITKFLSKVVEPDFKLARDLMAMAIADGEVTPEEEGALTAICRMEGIDESRLLESLRGEVEHVGEEMPNSRQVRAGYLRNLIKLIGADGYAAPQEVYLFQMIAGRMGLNQMDVMGLFLSAASYQYFKGPVGSKVLSSFLKNFIDPKGKTEHDNREYLRTIYNTVALNTEVSQGETLDGEALRRNLARATETFLENKLLVKEFSDAGLKLATMLKEEECRAFQRYCPE